MTQQFHPYWLLRKKKTCTHKIMYTNILSSITDDSQKVEAIQMSSTGG
jgi:hypothetical protein